MEGSRVSSVLTRRLIIKAAVIMLFSFSLLIVDLYTSTLFPVGQVADTGYDTVNAETVAHTSEATKYYGPQPVADGTDISSTETNKTYGPSMEETKTDNSPPMETDTGDASHEETKTDNSPPVETDTGDVPHEESGLDSSLRTTAESNGSALGGNVPDIPSQVVTGSRGPSQEVVGTYGVSLEAMGPLISIDVRNADIRDVLSALAMKIGVNIVMVDSKPQPITFQAKDIPCGSALDIIIKSKGLSYVKEGNIVVVGTPDMLQKDAFDQTILTKFETYYITAAKVKDLIGQLSITPVTVLNIDTDPKTIWAQGNAKSLQKVRELIFAVDREENAESLNYREIKTTYISPTRVLEVLKDAGIEVKNCVKLQNMLVVFDQGVLSRWDQVENLVKDFDFKDAESQTLFVHQLQNIVVGDAAQWLMQFDFANEIKIITPSNYERFSQEIRVICPPYLVNQVKEALVELDVPKKSIRMPVLTLSDKNAHAILDAKRSLLSELTGISQYNMNISKNVGTEDSPEYILWVEDTPDKVQEIKDMLSKF